MPRRRRPSDGRIEVVIRIDLPGIRAGRGTTIGELLRAINTKHDLLRLPRLGSLATQPDPNDGGVGGVDGATACDLASPLGTYLDGPDDGGPLILMATLQPAPRTPSPPFPPTLAASSTEK
ncbi:hypothetical protein HK101_005060, partial [Irineochytrium annulatum]